MKHVNEMLFLPKLSSESVIHNSHISNQEVTRNSLLILYMFVFSMTY